MSIQGLSKELYNLFLNIRDFGFAISIRHFWYSNLYYYTHNYKYRDRYIHLVQHYLTHLSEGLINKYNNHEDTTERDVSNNVWVCWWQGEEQMPEWIMMCYTNLKTNIPQQYNLVLITKNNYSKYVTIPDTIVEKREKNIIPITQFSDILRNALISQIGGIWIDSSIWITSNYWEMVKWDSDFWSVKLNKVYRPEMTGQVVSGCKWSSFNMYGKKNNIVNSFVFDAMCLFYTIHDRTLDYFGQNHFIRIAYDNIPKAKKIIDEIPYNNPCIYALPDLVYANVPFEQNVWDEMTLNTGAFKITQKRKYNEEICGQVTYYGYFKKLYQKMKK